MSNARDRRPLNPFSRLTTAFNAAQPVLSSHREGIAQAQRARAKAAADAESARATLEAQNASASPTTTPAVLNTPSLIVIPPDPACIDASLSSSLPITPATSQAGIIPPFHLPLPPLRERERIR